MRKEHRSRRLSKSARYVQHAHVDTLENIWYGYYLYRPLSKARVHRQVTGSVLMCMTDPEDVLEYVDSTATNFDVRRLLKWLARISENRDQRMCALDVRLNLLLLS